MVGAPFGGAFVIRSNRRRSSQAIPPHRRSSQATLPRLKHGGAVPPGVHRAHSTGEALHDEVLCDDRHSVPLITTKGGDHESDPNIQEEVKKVGRRKSSYVSQRGLNSVTKGYSEEVGEGKAGDSNPRMYTMIMYNKCFAPPLLYVYI